METIEVQTQIESLAPQPTSRESIQTFPNSVLCPSCEKEKHSFCGVVCFECYWNKRGEGFSWVTCPQCKEDWSKMTTSGLCWDCDQKGENDKEKQILIRKKLLDMFGSEKKMKELSFENFEQLPGTSKAYISCNEFDPEKENLYLWGKTGRGKTHLAYSIAQRFLRQGKSVDFLTMRELVNRFRLVTPLVENDTKQEMVKVDVLILDDIGRVANSDFAMDILVDILSKRALLDKSGLVVTSNLSLDFLSKQNNEDRITSRLAGMCKVIEVQGQFDVRKERRV